MPLEQWQIELQQCVRTLEQLEKYVPVSNVDRMREVLANMRLSITPHTFGLIDFQNPRDPLLLMSVPQERELTVTPEELADPIGDDVKSPIPFLTHRYPDRVLIHATFFCSHYCRFCFRRTKTGQATPGPLKQDIDRIAAYLRAHPEIEEVILTGGDPLTLMDSQIDEWLMLLRGIPSIRRIRFHTRVLVNLPSRITAMLVEIMKRHMDAEHPIFVVTHFNHPREIAPENISAVSHLVDSGIIVRNQSVLLRGVNDDPETLERLFKKLVDIRAIPYYLHQLDLARGTNHFRVPIEWGIELMRTLQGRVTGIALPRYVLDLPDGKGKIPLTHSYLTKRTDGKWEGESPFGERVRYAEPSGQKAADPRDETAESR